VTFAGFKGTKMQGSGLLRLAPIPAFDTMPSTQLRVRALTQIGSCLACTQAGRQPWTVCDPRSASAVAGQISLWPSFMGLAESVDLSTKNVHKAKNGLSRRLSGLELGAHHRVIA
jgi:hypothetical protein